MVDTSGYWPDVRGGTERKRIQFGDYEAVVLSDLESIDEPTYLYVMLVFKMPEGKLRLCVAAEELVMMEPGSGEYVLGLFPGGGHVNYGYSNDWADIEKFTRVALDLAKQEVKHPFWESGTYTSAEVAPKSNKPWWKFW